MKKLLRIDCSSRITGSHSRELGNYFEEKWLQKNPEGTVVYRDLSIQQLPHIQNNTIEGFYTPADVMTQENKKATALSDELITELKSVDELLICSPLYNLGTPSNLKAYFDQVVRVKHTFAAQEDRYVGLLENKTAYMITVKGAVYTGTYLEKWDFQEPYLHAILEHMGIKQRTLFSLEGTSDPAIVGKNKLELQNEINKTLA